jgi:glycosyltransferase involved in cell wall biosynthesis
MRILTLTNLFPNPYQPQRGVFNRQQLLELVRTHQVHVISPLAWTDELRSRRRAGARISADRQTTCHGIPVDHPRYLFPPKCFRGSYGHCFEASVRPTFERVLKQFEPELLYAPWAYPDGWAAVRLGHAAGLPVVIKVHGSDVLLSGRYPGRLRRTLEALQAADAIISVSEDLRQRMIEVGIDSSRIETIYDGVNQALFCPGSREAARTLLGIPTTAQVVLFVGNLVSIKGVDILIDAFAQLACDSPDRICYLIGHGPLGGSLQRHIDRLQLSSQIRLLGERAHAELPDWYRAADLFVLPSHSEGVPCVVLEAAACGTPIVASDVGGIPELRTWGELSLVAPGDVGALAGAMRRSLAALRPTTRVAGRVRSLAAAVGQIEACFSRVLDLSRQEVSP